MKSKNRNKSLERSKKDLR